jgi:hypothetical protein
MNVERSRRLAPLLDKLEIDKAGFHGFRHFNVSLMDALRVPLKTIQERIGYALTGSFTLDVYGHTLDWTGNEDAAKRLAEEIAKAIAEVERKQQLLNSGHLSAHEKEKLPSGHLEVSETK